MPTGYLNLRSYRNVARDEIDMLIAASFVCHVRRALRAPVVAKPAADILVGSR